MNTGTLRQMQYGAPSPINEVSPQKTAQESPVKTMHRSDMFPAPEWRDLWAAISFYLVVALNISLTVFCMMNLDPQPQPVGTNSNLKSTQSYSFGSELSSNLLIIGGSSLAASVIFSAGSLFAMRAFPLALIYGTFIGSILFNLGLLLFSVLTDADMLLSIISAFLLVVSIVMYFTVRSRIPMTAVLLDTVTACVKKFPGMYLATSVAMIVSTAITCWSTALIRMIMKLNENTAIDENILSSLIIFAIFSLYWMVGVCRNVLRTTISGVFATWYFLSGTGAEISNPVSMSAMRAMTYSFGSICFGSLIVSIIETIQFLLQLMSHDGSIAGEIIGGLLSLLKTIVKLFNRYAYTEIAIYGKPYIQAAKDTMNLISSRGIDAILNDCIVQKFTMSLTFCNICLCIAITVGYAQYLKVDILSYIMIMLLSIFIGYLIPSTVYYLVEVGSTTTFVCLAENPGAIRTSRPALYNSMMERYPQVLLDI
jgi:hypothetical protein